MKAEGGGGKKVGKEKGGSGRKKMELEEKRRIERLPGQALYGDSDEGMVKKKGYKF